MVPQDFNINNLRVASPCHVSWDSMTGDERVRHCQSCQLKIYNTAEMTTNEVHRLISTREGRLCIRMYRRADGTVLTKDCPVGLRAVKKKTVRLAAAAFGTILGLFSVSFGQKPDEKALDASKLEITRVVSQNEESNISGSVMDNVGAVIPGARVILIDIKDKKQIVTTNDLGEYAFLKVSPGVYRVDFLGWRGFESKKIKNLKIDSGQNIELNITLDVDETEIVTVGIYAEEPMIDTTYSGVITTIKVRP